MSTATCVVVTSLVILVAGQARAAGQPELPRLRVEPSPVASGGRTLSVGAGGNFQAALERARPGDVITLEAGATFVGPFTLPRKEGDGWITIRTSAPDDRLPPPDARIDPTHAGIMPKLEAGSGSVIVTAPRGPPYRVVADEIPPRGPCGVRHLVPAGAG